VNSHKNILTNNICSNNTDNGIYLSSSSVNTLTNNTCSNSIIDSLLYSSVNNTAINTTFTTINCSSTSSLTVKNYLHIKTQGSAISDVHVKVKDNFDTIYATSYFGGTNTTTNSDGLVCWILVTDRVYEGSSTATENTTTVEVWKAYWLFEDNPRELNMSTSHEEVFNGTYYGYTIVDVNGNGHYTSIQHAIDNATIGESIKVWNGT